MRTGVRVSIAATLLLVGSAACGGASPEASGSGEIDLARGQELFANNCAACHGPVGDGTASGPPLVHEIYEPGHHSDEAFHQAVSQGVQQHHWDFGPMPASPGLDRGQVDDITAYVRQLQRDAGIID